MKKRNPRHLMAVILFSFLLIAAIFITMLPNTLFQREKETGVTAENVIDDVSIRRSGSNYTLKSGIILYQDDEILVSRSGSCEVLAVGKIRAIMDRSSRLKIQRLTRNELAIKVLDGAVFFDLVQNTPECAVTVTTEEGVFSPVSGALFSVEAVPGTQTVNVYSGSGTFTWREDTQTLRPGDHVTMYQSEDVSGMSTADILSSELRGFLLQELLHRGGLCFDSAELEAIVARRALDLPEAPPEDDPDRLVCTIEIRCDTVAALPQARAAGLPEDGVLLPPTPVSFSQGENVYDVLHRVCKASGLQLDRDYMVMIGGYYIAGIGGLEQFDFSPASGWLYRVNNWYPNYGPSKYALHSGDVIVWEYTCDTSGADLGREEWQIREEKRVE